MASSLTEARPVNDGSSCMVEDFGEDDLLADEPELQTAVIQLARHYAGLDKYARRTEVIEARRQRFYRRGDQYIVWNPSVFGFVPWTGLDSNNGAPGQDSGRYTDVYNIYWPYVRALIAVGVQNPPGVDFQPDDPTKGPDITASRSAETYRFQWDRVNQTKKLQSDIMSKYCTDGRTVAFTRNVRDRTRFGTDENGKPVTVQLTDIGGVLETKCPILVDSLSLMQYFFWSDEIDWQLAREMYPAYAENIKQGSSAVGESAYERMARIGVLQGTRVLQQAGDAYAHLTTRHRLWLRPASFRHSPKDVAEQLREMFPDGMKLITCGDAYCGAFNQSMDDHLVLSWPAPGDGASKPSMLKDLVPVQDAFNDYKNLEKEIFDFTIPTTYRSNELGDPESLREQTSEPGNNIAVTRPANTALADCFYTEPPAGSPPSLVAAYQDLRGALSQFMSGAQPALFGGSDEHNETKGGIAMLRDQAMGQFSICWGAMQELFAGIYKQAAMECAKAAEDEKVTVNVSVPTKNGRSTVSSISPGDILKGNFHCYPDLDSSFPDTTGSKRQVLTQLVTQALTNPVATQAFGVLEPENLELQRELMGIHDWVIPSANSNDKQMMEIEILLKQRPTPNVQAIREYSADFSIEAVAAQNAEAKGIPADLPPGMDPDAAFLPSVKVDQKWDFHQFEYQTVKDWLSSPAGIEEAKRNPWGVLNVKLHGLQHLAAMGQQQPPPQPQPAPGLARPPQPGPMNQPITPAIM